MKELRGEFQSSKYLHQQPLKLLLCESPMERLRGLLGRENLLADSVLWLLPCSSIHTCFMHHHIDVVYLDSAKCVKKLVVAMQPWKLSSCFSAASVLELENGRIERMGLQLGDRLLCER